MFGNGRTKRGDLPGGALAVSFNATENCAAVAITCAFSYCMGRTSEYGDYGDYKAWSRVPTPSTMANAVKKMQLALGWRDSKFISALDMAESVNRVFPSLRLVIIHGIFNKASRFPGPTYEVESDSMDKGAQRSLYILHQMGKDGDHYTMLTRPSAYFSSIVHNHSRFCVPCAASYDCRSAVHEECLDAENPRAVKRKRAYKKCQQCDGVIYGSVTRHECNTTYCVTCQLNIPKGEYRLHRCSITDKLAYADTAAWAGQVLPEDEDDEGDDTSSETPNAKAPGEVWAYDFECCIEWADEETRMSDVVLDPNGEFDPATGTHLDMGKIIIRHRKIATHKPCMVIAKQCFVNEAAIEFATADEFFTFVIGRPVKTYWYAHNASGYDSRLVYDAAIKRGIKPDHATFNGTKIMRLQFGKHTFLDTMLHMMGSLASLAKAFGLGEIDPVNPNRPAIKKGYFPHLWNTVERQGYVGAIPPLWSFGHSTLRNANDQAKMAEWHAAQVELGGDWDMQEEMLAYCHNDVELLVGLLTEYDKACREMTGGITPIGVVTSAGYAHKVFKRKYLYPFVTQWDTWQARSANSWPVLEPEEYYLPQAALRGGRTQTHQKQTLPQPGEKLVSIDVCSQYPGVQINKDFPVGLPIIHVNDFDAFPCSFHYTKYMGDCGCHLTQKMRKVNPKLDISSATMYDHSFDWRGKFGFGVFDVTFPSRQYHPTLPRFDDSKKKCLFSLEPMVKECLFSEELALAVSRGARVVKCHVFHEYKRAPSLWKQFTKDFFRFKLVNSKPPSQESCDRYWALHTLKIRREECIHNGPKRMIAKILCNSAWGKNAENPDKVEVEYFRASEMQKYCEFLAKEGSDRITIKDQFLMNMDMIGAKYSTNFHGRTKPDFSKAFICPAVCVPAYGRMQLEVVMHEFGKAVHMNDTDSIHIAISEHADLSHIVPNDPIIGEFEFENELIPGLPRGTPKTMATVQGYQEKLMAGSKSYMTIYDDGTASLKFKGLCVTDRDGKIAPRLDALLNPGSFRDVVLLGKTLMIPTFNFRWDPKVGGIRTIEGVKRMTATGGKGQQVGNYNYPYGYAVSAEEQAEGDAWIDGLAQ